MDNIRNIPQGSHEQEPSDGVAGITRNSSESFKTPNNNGITYTTAEELLLLRPTPFNGHKRKFRPFLLECGLYLHINSHIYNSDARKVAFILSFMTEGNAALWKTPYLQSIQGTPGNIEWDTWDQFIAKIEEEFKPEDEIDIALHELNTLKQGHDAADTHILRFKILAEEAGLSGDTKSDNIILISCFKRSLNKRLRQRIVNGETIPTTIKEWYQRASLLDRNLRYAETITKRSHKRGTFTSSS